MDDNSEGPNPWGERRSPDEAGLIEQIMKINLSLLDTSARPVRRGQHPKQHGCVEADFVVEPDLPRDLRHGVFREPRSYTALIRFSSGREWDDTKGDIHGMAIKLLDVDGEKVLEAEKHERTQDFIMADSPVFFIRDLADYVPFSKDVYNAAKRWWGRPVLGLKLLLSPYPTWKLLKKAVASKPDSPLRARYWSQTPYRLGPSAIRFSAQPDLSTVPPPLPSDSKEKFREQMAAHLKDNEARFDFLVQVQTDTASMPVEDPTVPWDEKVSPFRKVASIRIPPQTFDTPERMNFCENLSYTPWHALEDHRPLGGINRARKLVYELISKERHKRNDVPRKEPSREDIPGGRGS